MLKKINIFINQSFSEKYYSLLWMINKFRTKLFYQYLLNHLGNSSIVCKPLYWTPERISIGNNCYIWEGSRLHALKGYKGQLFDSHIILEDHVSIQERCHIAASSELIIRKNTTIASNVMIQDLDHEYMELNVNILNQRLISRKVDIGENCFFGTGTKILAGTVLGKQCIVGANSVVRGRFPDYCVIAGAPAKIVKKYNLELKIWEKIK